MVWTMREDVRRASIPKFLELGEFQVTPGAYPFSDWLVKVIDFKVSWGDTPVGYSVDTISVGIKFVWNAKRHARARRLHGKANQAQW